MTDLVQNMDSRTAMVEQMRLMIKPWMGGEVFEHGGDGKKVPLSDEVVRDVTAVIGGFDLKSVGNDALGKETGLFTQAGRGIVYINTKIANKDRKFFSVPYVNHRYFPYKQTVDQKISFYPSPLDKNKELIQNMTKRLALLTDESNKETYSKVFDVNLGAVLGSRAQGTQPLNIEYLRVAGYYDDKSHEVLAETSSGTKPLQEMINVLSKNQAHRLGLMFVDVHPVYKNHEIHFPFDMTANGTQLVLSVVNENGLEVQSRSGY